MPAHFTPALFTFLANLKKHNTREWFEAHRDDYVRDVETPLRTFITDVGPHLRTISTHIVADPRRMGGSMYRIHRDTRFSADKTPYKTNVAAHFKHDAHRKVPSVPGFYLHLERGDSMAGGGIYHPDSPTLTRVRLAIAERPKAWADVKATGIEIRGDRLKRPPVGFDASHRFIEDLKLKDFFSLEPFTQAQVTSADFLDRYVASCERVAPLMGFISQALQLKW